MLFTFNPATTAQIHQAGGIYLTQAKENQPVYLQQCQALRTESRDLQRVGSRARQALHSIRA
ncbi:MAG: hypothetical protein NTX45_28855 [Proteobacteria bacterium]|nr:hypothetical protein [Pseudomonadota bacterium]